MKTLIRKCEDNNTVGSFCDCVSGGESADPAATAFCNRAKTDTKINGDDLDELKKALIDLEDDGCCEC